MSCPNSSGLKVQAYSIFAFVMIGLCDVSAENACTTLGSCNSHGTCTSLTKVCECLDGWGSATDNPLVPVAPDCSERVCPQGVAWGDVPTSTNQAHAVMECSNAGLCDRSNGICKCFAGFEGEACQRYACPNSCSSHGQCMSLSRLAGQDEAQPLSSATAYGGAETTTTWDEEKISGCLCDSSWTVGFDATETQLAEYFGPDCSLRHCPSGNDPMTTADETDCENLLQDPYTFKTTNTAGTANTGASGNLCHVDCSNRGKCDFSSGICSCFPGYSGANCASQDVLAI